MKLESSCSSLLSCYCRSLVRCCWNVMFLMFFFIMSWKERLVRWNLSERFYIYTNTCLLASLFVSLVFVSLFIYFINLMIYEMYVFFYVYDFFFPIFSFIVFFFFFNQISYQDTNSVGIFFTFNSFSQSFIYFSPNFKTWIKILKASSIFKFLFF